MRVAQVIGTVTLNKCHPSYVGARLRLVVPLSLDDLRGQTDQPEGESLVCWDELGAGLGDKIAVAEGPEASMPFRPEIKPVEAYNAAILDRVELHLDS
jgi:carbon dioxide concentrating mechanism protein CcmL